MFDDLVVPRLGYVLSWTILSILFSILHFYVLSNSALFASNSLDKKWTHEEASQMMIEHLANDNNLDKFLDDSDIKFIKQLINGDL